MKKILRKCKQMIIKIIGNGNYKAITIFFYRLINNYHKKFWVCISKDNYITLREEKRNTYFGYYDYSAEKDNKVLFISTENNLKKDANIGYYDLISKNKKYIAKTKAWNYQMGSRLRWINDDIIVNDYDYNEGFISKILDINGKCKKKFKFPVYDISRDKKYSFYLDFTILNHFRPGYGYTNIEERLDSDRLNRNGVYRGSFINNSIEFILSIEEIVNYKKEKLNSTSNHYINHIYCSKFDDIIMFFHLWNNEKNESLNRVFIIDYTGKILNVLDDFEKASHYGFKSKNELLLTVVVNGKIQYRLYNIEDSSYKILEFLTVDGHPSYIDDTNFITDTYPDHNGMQHIYLCDDNGIKEEILQIYHNPKKTNEYRCDLHPRYSNGILTFDSISGKYRNENILKLDLLNLPQIDFPKISDNKKIYMNLFHKVDTNNIKVMYKRMFDFSYNAHILVNKMLKTKSKFKRNLYYNKLQKDYSMWISPNCKIGKNIHFMHLDGITIGSGVKIGDNCTIYHQVTIGKEKNGFPIIGNNVTIYAGAKVIGAIKIGNNAVIGANAVVLQDVPDDCVAVGIPARIIKKKD